MDEFRLIRQYFASLTPAVPALVLGIGDDCALLQPPPGQQLAITSDSLVAGRHFPADTAPEDIGWKALAVNLSDLAAMGAQASTFLLALTLPAFDPRWLEGFARGLGELAGQAGVALVGGDTTRGPLAITITALGWVPQGAALRRDGARPGDLVCVTGTLGDAALALRRLGEPDLPTALRQRLDRPQPRLAAGLALRGLASAAIDLSDGLAGDLGHILAASGVGAELAADDLPVSPAFAAAQLPVRERLALQLQGGDDYELCFCLPEGQLAAARAALPLPFTVIGRIGSAPGLWLRGAQGARESVAPEGYRHF